jgi:hypothetical protein
MESAVGVHEGSSRVFGTAFAFSICPVGERGMESV